MENKAATKMRRNCSVKCFNVKAAAEKSVPTTHTHWRPCTNWRCFKSNRLDINKQQSYWSGQQKDGSPSSATNIHTLKNL